MLAEHEAEAQRTCDTHAQQLRSAVEGHTAQHTVALQELGSQHEAALEELRLQHAIAAETFGTQLRGMRCATSAAVQNAQVSCFERLVAIWMGTVDVSRISQH